MDKKLKSIGKKLGRRGFSITTTFVELSGGRWEEGLLITGEDTLENVVFSIGVVANLLVVRGDIDLEIEEGKSEELAELSEILGKHFYLLPGNYLEDMLGEIEGGGAGALVKRLDRLARSSPITIADYIRWREGHG